MRTDAAKAGSRLGGALVGALALFFVALGILAGSARAADSVYWADFALGQIFRADLAGGPPVEVPLPNEGRRNLGGVAVDPAAGKLYWAQTTEDASAIMVANLDGSGAHPLNTAGSGLGIPLGLTIDSRGGRIYWANIEVEEGGDRRGTISFARLDGTGGGLVDTTGASIELPEGVAVYPAAGRIYWADTTARTISFANLAGGGGGDLAIDPDAVREPVGVAIDATSQRVHWANFGADTIGSTSLAGGAATELAPSGIDNPLGVALDTAANRLFWGQADPPGLMFANALDGSGVGGFDLSGLSADALAIFPILFKAPVSAGAPTVSGRPAPGATLTCASAWLPDAPEAQLYRAAQTVSYQWLRGAEPVAGASLATFKPRQAGSYSCQSTATNGAGSTASAASKAVSVRASLKLRKARLNPNKGTATLTLSVDSPGAIVAGGKGVLKAKKLAARAGTYRLTVRATGKAKRKLLATGRTRVKVRVAFTPLGAKALKRSKSIVLKRR